MKLAISFIAAMIVFCGFIALCIYAPLTLANIALVIIGLIVSVPIISVMAFVIYGLFFDR